MRYWNARVTSELAPAAEWSRIEIHRWPRPPRGGKLNGRGAADHRITADMNINYLDHVNIRTSELERLVTFYTEVLGFQVGQRPDFAFPGAWLYCGDRPVVHLIAVDDTPRPGNALSLEHFAFAAEGLGVDDRAVPTLIRKVPLLRDRGVFELTDHDLRRLDIAPTTEILQQLLLLICFDRKAGKVDHAIVGRAHRVALGRSGNGFGRWFSFQRDGPQQPD